MINISPAWVRVLRGEVGMSEVLARGVRSRAYTCGVRVSSNADVIVGDILKGPVGEMRVLEVVQIAPESNTKTALCKEIAWFIPDDFEHEVIDPFWVASGAGFSVNKKGELELAPAVAALAGDGALLYQDVMKDFDVWAAVDVVAGPPTYRGFIGARFESGFGVYICVRNDGAAVFTRIDQYDAAAQVETVSSDSGRYVRLQRRGAIFHTYYSTKASDPTDEKSLCQVAR